MDVVRNEFGDERLSEQKHASMAAEDFAFYLQKVPGVFLYLGQNPDPSQRYANLHSPYYDFNDDTLPAGIKLLSSLALTFLNERGKNT